MLINDLEVNNADNIWKYVDNTTTSEIVVKGARSNFQFIADTVMQWSFENRVKLNSEKCKELRISFANSLHGRRSKGKGKGKGIRARDHARGAKYKPQLAPIVANNQELGCVESAKLLGVTISNNPVSYTHLTLPTSDLV